MDQELNFKYTSLLNDPELDKKLSDLGYAIFPILNEGQIKQLSDYYFSHETNAPDHFYSSTHSNNIDFRKRSSDCIKEIVSPLLRGKLKNYKVLGGAFVVKPANGKGALAPHQDWNIVDENKFRSYNLWVPLVNVNSENGAVYVQGESHRKLRNFRGPGIASPFKNIESVVWEKLNVLPMKAGEALLYDHALIHGSPNNKTATIRLGIVVGIIPETAEMQICYGNGNKINIYQTNESFFLEKDPMKGPEGLKQIAEQESNAEELDAKTYEHIYLNKKQNKSWIKKILWG